MFPNRSIGYRTIARYRLRCIPRARHATCGAPSPRSRACRQPQPPPTRRPQILRDRARASARPHVLSDCLQTTDPHQNPNPRCCRTMPSFHRRAEVGREGGRFLEGNMAPLLKTIHAPRSVRTSKPQNARVLSTVLAHRQCIALIYGLSRNPFPS